MTRQPITVDKNVARQKNSAYQVQKDVALPRRQAMWAIYPFLEMEVGDSFALLKGDLLERERVRAAASYYGIRHAPKKFSIRIADPSANPKTYRCWRVS
jgi:hypothetical protein